MPVDPGTASECKQEPGVFRPQVSRGACEGKKACVEVCPYDVFEVRTIEASDFAGLNFLEKLKVRVHGKQTAYTPRAADCRACGKCVIACPEQAITLVRADR